MRAIDDSGPRFAAVLRELLIWKQLPESDLARLVRQYFLVTDDFRDMEDEGLLTLAFSGDEYLVSVTTLGRFWLEQYDNTHEKEIFLCLIQMSFPTRQSAPTRPKS